MATKTDKTLTGREAIRYVERRLGQPLEVLLRFPRFVYVEPVNQCNARCVMCGINFRRARQFMPEPLFGKIVDELSRHGEHLERVGLYLDCEPLLDPGLGGKIAALKRAGIRRTYLNSNMSLMTPERAEELIRSGLDLIYITIDSLRPERYEAIRRGLQFETVYGNTRAFIHLRDRLNPGLVIRIQMIGQPANAGEADAFIAHWKALVGPGDQVVVRPAHNWGALVDTPLPAAKEVINAAPCIGLWSTLGIHVSGAVHICCVDTAGQVVLGNVAAESIAEIWRGPALERLRRMHLEGDRCRIGPCDGCTVWYEAEGAQGGRSDV